jgi:Zn-dependent metalloprotease
MHICAHTSQHHPLYCIIPPHMLEQIAQNGTPNQKALAQQTLAMTESFRLERQAIAKGEIPSGAVSMAPGPAAAGGVKQRFVYTANNTSTLPGQLVRQEGSSPSGDVAVNEAYDGAGYTYDLFWNIYQRNSIDNQGMSLLSTVHYQRGYDNAFWNGQQMVYGDGDEGLPPAQQLFNRFTISVDVIGHELTHGVTEHEANLVYSNQSGALNESWSDVFGSLVKQNRNNQTARNADWIIGEGLFTANVHGVGIRSMKAPGTAYDDPVLGKDPQPATMSGYVSTTQDNGGVHLNSGIPNHAFYVTAYEIDGYAWEKAGKIWYTTLTSRLSSTASFQDAANATYAVAGDLYGANSLEQQAVQKGWAEVGITVGGSTTTPGCLPSALLALFRPSNSARR